MTDTLKIQARLHSEAARIIRRQRMFLVGLGVSDRVIDRIFETVLQAVYDGLGEGRMMDDAQHRVAMIASAADVQLKEVDNEDS